MKPEAVGPGISLNDFPPLIYFFKVIEKDKLGESLKSSKNKI
jgi:hypothetical protein